MNDLLQSLRSLGYARLAVLAAVGVGMLAFFIFLLVRFNNPDFAPLYSELSPEDAGAISQALDSQGIPYQAGPAGTGIMVPRDQVGRARMLLAANGLPSGGNAGWKLMDQAPAFGMTNAQFEVMKQRVLEGELQRSIETLSPVKAARVQLVMPAREMFSTETQPPSASVVLTLNGGVQLSAEQIAAIRHLVAGAVPAMTAGDVSIIDQSGRLLAKPDDANDPGMISEANAGRRVALEQQIAMKLENMLAATLGPGKARVAVTADLDFDRVTTTAEEFNPDQQVVRSSQTVSDKNSSQDGDNQPVTVNTNLPGGQQTAPQGGGSTSRTTGDRTEETTNYEIGKIVRQTSRDGGLLKKISVAVAVDGTTTVDDKGDAKYTPLAKEQLASIETLVKAAVGFDQARGDVVQVVNQQFAGNLPPAPVEDSSIMGFPREDLIGLAQTAVTALVILLALLLVVRPIVTKALTTPAAGNIVLTEGTAGAGMGGEMSTITIPGGAAGIAGMPGGMPPGIIMPGMAQGLMPGAVPGMPNSALAQAMSQSHEPDMESQIDQMINLTQVEGRVRASSLRKIGDIIEKHPDEAVSILRNWMYQEQPQG